MKKLSAICLLFVCLVPSLVFADAKISAWTATTSMATTDIIPLVYNFASTPASRYITFGNLQTQIMGSTGARNTKGWFTDLEVTNYPTVNGATVFNQAVTSTSNPAFLTLNLVGANALNLGTSGTYDGEVRFKSGTGSNNYYFKILGSNFGANIGWTLPTAAPAGNGYLVTASTAGVLSYTDPATLTGTGDLKADGTVPLTADWDVGAYTITAKGFTAKKATGVAGLSSVYEANSTDTDYVAWMGPSSISESWSYQFSATQPSAGQAMVFSAPTGSGDPNGKKVSTQSWITPATLTGAETLSGKTLTAPKETVVAGGTCSTSYTPDLAAGSMFTLTLSGACQLANPSNLAAGQSMVVRLTQSSTTAPTFGTAYNFAATPTWSTTATNYDTLSCYSPDGTRLECSGPTTGSIKVASGTSALGTGAISSGACATAVTTSATNVATTDVINWGFNGDPTGVTGYAPSANGMLTIVAYPSANNVNFKVCNNTGASITPGAVTLNWIVVR